MIWRDNTSRGIRNIWVVCLLQSFLHVCPAWLASWLHMCSWMSNSLSFAFVGAQRDIPYIRLFTRHVLSANSNLKSCIKSTREHFSRNPSESFKIYFKCKIVSNLRDWIFHDFDTLANIAENGCSWKKPDIRYMSSI